SPQEAPEFLVNRSEALLRIDGEEDDVGFADRGVCRVAHFLHQFALPSSPDSSGVPNDKITTTARRRNPVAGDPGLIVHNSDVAPDKAIEESRLTDVRPANDRDLATGWCFHRLTF